MSQIQLLTNKNFLISHEQTSQVLASLASFQAYVIKTPQNEASTLSHTDLYTTHVLTKSGPVNVIKFFQSEYRCQQIILSHWFLQLTYLNSKTKLLIILGIYQKHQDQFEY